MTNLKSITELPVAETAEGLNLIVNDHGAAKQIPAGEVGAQADFAVTDENSPAFIKNKPKVAQSDWAVTDESNPAYIKNKPIRELIKEWNFGPDDWVFWIEEEIDEDLSWMTTKSDTVGFEIVFEAYGVDSYYDDVAPTSIAPTTYASVPDRVVVPDTVLCCSLSDVGSKFVTNSPWDSSNYVENSSEFYFYNTDNYCYNTMWVYCFASTWHGENGSYIEIYNESWNPFKSIKIYKIIK